MELVHCFGGMTIFCGVIGIIFWIIALISNCKDNLERTDKYLGWFKSFIYCEFYFLALEIVAKFFA